MARYIAPADSATASLVSTVDNNWTIAVWLKVINFPGVNAKVFCNGNVGANGYGILVDTSQVRGLHGGIAFVGGATVSTGVWVHALLSRRAGTSTLWVAGVSAGGSGAGVNTPGTSTVISGDGLDAWVGHPALWEHALTDLEIVALAKGCPPNRVGRVPKAYWPMVGLVSPEIDAILGNVFPFTLGGAPAVVSEPPMQPYATIVDGNYLASPAPVNVTPPVASGTATVGSVVSTTNGTWTFSPSSFTYQWQDSADGMSGFADIPGATSQTYEIEPAYSGRYVRCVVTAINSAGEGVANSNALGPIGAYPTVRSFSVIA